ncbi:patatin family protein [Heterostelium album PN500]|uniref:Patatin family protein n=1 Tax=Heterostelium pallidum (strain ATCC 26659 / Pp 5 / PN500) TaxID=670386 RepID=D3BH52_HETP5|nr:patatin family protein [Heterostelium album PN500]EFA79436.1 patatin family protein [Heterostelium album PN500]|eukprot:XP_020431557.1 patatin family protein [Heterostelium album PN500]
MQSPSHKPKLIISCDGGGMRGIQLEKDLGCDIFARASLIGGTSTGGMITFSRMAGHSNEDIRDLYITVGREVFKTDCRNIVESQSIANTKMFSEALTKLYNQSTLSDFSPLVKGFVTTSATNILLPHLGPEPFILSNYNNPTRAINPKEIPENHSIVHAVRATSAIPMLFSTPTYKNYTYMDGGYFNNNPINLTHQEAVNIFGMDNIHECIFISFGTGYQVTKTDMMSNLTSSFTTGTKFVTTNIGKVIENPLTRIINFMTGSSFEIHQQFQKANPNLHYFRFDPVIDKNIGVNDVSEPSIAYMKEEATRFTNSKEYKEMVLKIKGLLDF